MASSCQAKDAGNKVGVSNPALSSHLTCRRQQPTAPSLTKLPMLAAPGTAGLKFHTHIWILSLLRLILSNDLAPCQQWAWYRTRPSQTYQNRLQLPRTNSKPHQCLFRDQRLGVSKSSHPKTCSWPFFTPSRNPCSSRALLLSTNRSRMQASRHQVNCRKEIYNLGIPDSHSSVKLCHYPNGCGNHRPHTGEAKINTSPGPRPHPRPNPG